MYKSVLKMSVNIASFSRRVVDQNMLLSALTVDPGTLYTSSRKCPAFPSDSIEPLYPFMGTFRDPEVLGRDPFGKRTGWIGRVYEMSNSSSTVLRLRMNSVRRAQRPPQSCQFGRSERM